MKGGCIDIDRLPGQNPLPVSFLNDFDRVAKWYSRWADDDELLERARTVADQPHLERGRLIDAMAKTHQRLGAGDRSGTLLETLKRGNAVAVLTGQQVGLLGGPAYSIYKALTAIRLARRLEELGQPAVPVFWLAADDSDFEEVQSTWLASASGELLQLSVPGRPEEGTMVGTIPLDGSEQWLAEAGRLLDQGAFQAYCSGEDLRTAFGRWIAHLFQSIGLALFDPLEDDIRAEASEFFLTAVRQREEIVSRLLGRDAELRAEGFSPQVHIDEAETLLFLVNGSRRFKLEFRNGRYKVKGRPQLSFTPQELEAHLQAHPGALAPNALLRPLLQDHLLPCVATVGGPGEVAYFAQLSSIAAIWQQDPVVVCRAAFTLVDRRVQRLLKKYDLSIEQVITESADQVAERLMAQKDAGATLGRLDRLRESIEHDLTELQEELKPLDFPVSSMLETSSRKILYQIDKVRRRFVDNQSRNDEILRRHLQTLRNRLRPRDNLQERVLNFNQFLTEDAGLLERLLEKSDPNSGGHQVVYL